MASVGFPTLALALLPFLAGLASGQTATRCIGGKPLARTSSGFGGCRGGVERVARMNRRRIHLPTTEQRSRLSRCRAVSPDVKDDIEKLKQSIQSTAQVDSTPQVRDPLPPSSKGEIFRACFLVSGIVGSAGVGLRQYAATKLQTSGADADLVRQLTSLDLNDLLHVDAKDIAIMVAAGLGVTALRKATMAIWEDYQWATDRSNEQVLRPLALYDLLWVSLLPGISEELLFRGALIPAVYPDWRGVLIGALTFGVLHNSGGRNLASATFATLAGGIYGAAFLGTNNLLVAMGAHSLSNFLSAYLWLQEHPKATVYKAPKKPKMSPTSSLDPQNEQEMSDMAGQLLNPQQPKKIKKKPPKGIKRKLSESRSGSTGGFGAAATAKGTGASSSSSSTTATVVGQQQPTAWKINSHDKIRMDVS